ncbi:hypothetical protein QBC34DRAFT_387828 [Podospora aff. communis PSN243]|uniref:Chitin-binding type-2 domain-containing protein n=1 Tax=Podospora aff. communis PSN243 TaxID=3040156 RepID=A0AAV9FX96_9PEZI|nr:hypothetical protein QBC34DRAFT_387828 [Podospora aff. communis PSN243]
MHIPTIFAALMATTGALAQVTNLSPIPKPCRYNTLFPRNGFDGPKNTCQWWVCTENNGARIVRDCGPNTTCAPNPTTCVSKTNGQPF